MVLDPRLTRVLRAGPSETLGAAGFRGRGVAWMRRRGAGLVDVVTFQKGGHSPDLCVNVGIAIPALDETVCADPPERRAANPLREYDCVASARLPLGGGERWWPLDAPEDSGTGIAEALRITALPLLDRIDTPETLALALSGRNFGDPWDPEAHPLRVEGALEWMRLAALCAQTGDPARARGILDALAGSAVGAVEAAHLREALGFV